MVTLVDGRMVFSDAEEWRHECEARMLLQDYSPRGRAELLAAIGEQRGVGAAEDLRRTIAQLEGQGA
jgi:hypothetical protein